MFESVELASWIMNMYHCEHCNEKSAAKQKLSLLKLPRITCDDCFDNSGVKNAIIPKILEVSREP